MVLSFLVGEDTGHAKLIRKDDLAVYRHWRPFKACLDNGEEREDETNTQGQDVDPVKPAPGNHSFIAGSHI